MEAVRSTKRRRHRQERRDLRDRRSVGPDQESWLQERHPHRQRQGRHGDVLHSDTQSRDCDARGSRLRRCRQCLWRLDRQDGGAALDQRLIFTRADLLQLGLLSPSPFGEGDFIWNCHLPITKSENQVAISGKMHKITIAMTINTTKGTTPQMTSRSGISGAMFFMTKMFNPTGGWMRPISITIVMITPNQTRSNCAARSGGRMIGAVMRMMDTGGRKNPRTTTITRIANSSTQRDRCRETIHSAADWLMWR